MFNNRTCGQCALMQQNGGMCPLFNQPMSPDELGCPAFASELFTCEICGQQVPTRGRIIDVSDENDLHFFCASCKKHCNHCPSCVNAQNCSFETDPSPLPKTIQQQIRQGNMVQIMTVRNPSRIEITCKKGCPCFSEEFGCSRQNNSCGNYKVIYAT